MTTKIVDSATDPTPAFFKIPAADFVLKLGLPLEVEELEELEELEVLEVPFSVPSSAVHAAMNVALPCIAVNFVWAFAALAWISASFVVLPFANLFSLVWLFATSTNFCSVFIKLHSSFCWTAGQAACKVELLVSVCSLAAASEALSWMSAILVALFWVAVATAVLFAANLMKRWRAKVSWHPLSSAFWASITAQADTRVLFDSRALSLVEAEDALAWISAIFVALFLVTLSSLVVLDASSTSALSLFISLHWPFSEGVLVSWVPLPLAATEVARRRERTIEWKCMM